MVATGVNFQAFLSERRSSDADSWLKPLMEMSLFLLVCPLMMLISSLFMLDNRLRKAISSLLALPFTGGAEILIRNTSFTNPIISFLPAFG